MNDYSIGVVTYHARYDRYFKPLIEQLSKIFPDREIVVVMNGHPDQTLQLAYLDRATRFLRQFRNLRYVAHTDHQSLSRCWNQLVILSGNENVLILNDDTEISELFRIEMESLIGTAPLITYNRSWSHFSIHKSLIKEVGWFDERFAGVGYEDGDYAYRMATKQIPITNADCDGLRNIVAPNDDPGFKSVSKSKGKYAIINEEFFNRKWQNPDNSPHIDSFAYVSDFNGGQKPFTPVPGMETPLFYDLESLDHHGVVDIKREAPTISRLRLSMQFIYFRLGRRIARIMRFMRRIVT